MVLQVSKQISEVGRNLQNRGLVTGTDGNISVRLDDNRILITATGCRKDQLGSQDLVTVDIDGHTLGGNARPSSELAMHLLVYRERPEIMACVHAHPPFATARGVAGKPLPPDVLPEVVLFVGPIALTDYAPPGTEAVPASIGPYVADHQAFLMRNHGLLTIGRTLDEAWNRMETVEHYARILHLAEQVGNVNHISADDFTRLTQMRQDLDSKTSA